MTKIIKIFIILIILLVSFETKFSFAATLYFDPSIDKNGYTLIRVMLDTDNETLNAVEGKVVYPLYIKNIDKVMYDGNSSINFWIEKPVIIKNGEISFSGITPGGISGNKFELFNFIIKDNLDQNGQIKFQDINIYKNNGEGTKVKVNYSILDLPISQKFKDTNIEQDIKKDIIPPEDFKPILVKDKNLFDGNKVIIFSTQDKDSGMSHYEIREGYFDKFHIENSPYLLKNQNSIRKIYIKALDNANNSRLVEFYPTGYLYWYQLCIIIAIILIVLFILIKLWKKFIK